MKFLVDNMSCKHCKMRIENALKEAGFKKIDVDVEKQIVTVKMGNLTVETAKNAIEGIGYHFQVIE